MKTQETKDVIFSGSDLIEGIVSAKNAVGTLNLTDVTELTPRVGKAIREAYHWINPADPCYLVMDNAGGHGTKDCINEYTQICRGGDPKKTIYY